MFSNTPQPLTRTRVLMNVVERVKDDFILFFEGGESVNVNKHSGDKAGIESILTVYFNNCRYPDPGLVYSILKVSHPMFINHASPYGWHAIFWLVSRDNFGSQACL